MTLVLYFSRAFLGRFLAVLLGFSAILQLLDLLDKASTVLDRGRGAGDMLIYISLRFPILMTQIVPLAVLVGLVSTYFSLARHQEIVALRFAGVSPWFFLKVLTPALSVLMIFHFLLLGQITPLTELTLRDWWSDRMLSPEEQATVDPVWLRAGQDVVSIAAVYKDGVLLSGVTIYARNDSGQVTDRIVARTAVYKDGAWTLRDVRIIHIDKGRESETAEPSRSWPEGPKPANIVFVADAPAFLSPQRSLSILHGVWSGTKPLSYYRTQLQTAFAQPLSLFVLLLLAQPALRGGRRGETFAVGAMSSLSLGLFFLLVQGLMTALAEANTLPPPLAVWFPLILFSCIGGSILLFLEE